MNKYKFIPTIQSQSIINNKNVNNLSISKHEDHISDYLDDCFEEFSTSNFLFFFELPEFFSLVLFVGL